MPPAIHMPPPDPRPKAKTWWCSLAATRLADRHRNVSDTPLRATNSTSKSNPRRASTTSVLPNDCPPGSHLDSISKSSLCWGEGSRRAQRAVRWATGRWLLSWRSREGPGLQEREDLAYAECRAEEARAARRGAGQSFSWEPGRSARASSSLPSEEAGASFSS
jgi:hypothetical protein